jgi:hypothetical protein
MRRIEAIEELMMASSGVVKDNIKKYDEPFDKLVNEGFVVVRERPLKRGFYAYVATAATPLALLTKTQFLCAQQLAKSGEIWFNAAPKAQKKHMDKLVENGWAGWRSSQPPAQFVGRVWVPTPKLIEAIDCWRKAKGGGNGK